MTHPRLLFPPGTEEYAHGTSPLNSSADQHPGFVAVPGTAADVSEIVTDAAARDPALRQRRGGTTGSRDQRARPLRGARRGRARRTRDARPDRGVVGKSAGRLGLRRPGPPRRLVDRRRGVRPRRIASCRSRSAARDHGGRRPPRRHPPLALPRVSGMRPAAPVPDREWHGRPRRPLSISGNLVELGNPKDNRAAFADVAGALRTHPAGRSRRGRRGPASPAGHAARRGAALLRSRREHMAPGTGARRRPGPGGVLTSLRGGRRTGVSGGRPAGSAGRARGPRCRPTARTGRGRSHRRRSSCAPAGRPTPPPAGAPGPRSGRG